MNTTNKLVLSVLALSSLVSCEKSDDIEFQNTQIKLGADIIQTKAPVDSINDVDLSSIGVYGIRDSIWTVTPLIDNNLSTVDNTGNIDLTGVYFYPAEGDTVDFYAYHPYVATGTSGSNYVTAPSAATPPFLNFTITGQEDIMYATSVFGSKISAPPAALNFNHALTQLKFKAKTGLSFPNLITVTSITFNGVNTKGKMNIADGTLSAWGTPSGSLTSAVTNSGAISTTGTATDVGEPVMLQPGLSSFNVDIVTTFGTFSNISIVPTGSDTNFVAGKAYTVILTFTATGIELSATVSPWTNTGTGAGAVQ